MEASKSLVISDIATIAIILSRKQISNVLIRLPGCAGWSEPLLFVVLSLFVIIQFKIRKSYHACIFVYGSPHFTNINFLSDGINWYVCDSHTEIFRSLEDKYEILNEVIKVDISKSFGSAPDIEALLTTLKTLTLRAFLIFVVIILNFEKCGCTIWRPVQKMPTD